MSLKRFLVLLPGELDFSHYKAIQHNVYKALYYSVTADGKFLPHLFPNASEDQLAELKDYGFPITIAPPAHPFYENFKPAQLGHPKNKACARAFGNGDSVYQCKDCQFDETCVICQDCFNPLDHVGHNVNVYRLRGTSGGICDCGDPEAFTTELHCRATILADHFDAEFDAAIASTIRECLDYVLDVTSFSIHTIPFIHRNYNGEGDLAFSSKQISDFSSLPPSAYDANDANSNHKWVLMLWNDEKHDYREAIKAIRDALGCSQPAAKKLADEIDAVGRGLLLEAASYTELLGPKRATEADGLVALVFSARDYMRELIVQHIVAWLQEVVEFLGNAVFRERCRQILAEVLLEENFEFAKPFPMELLRDTRLDLKKACYESGFLYEGELVNYGSCSVNPNVSPAQLNLPAKRILTHRPQTFSRSRLQYLLNFDIRFPSVTRKRLGKFIVPTLVLDPETKAVFAKQVFQIYPNLLMTMAVSDREEDLNMLINISSQLFTCPKTMAYVTTENLVGNVIGPVAQLIEDYSSAKDPESGYNNFVEIIVDIRSKREKRSIKRAIIQGIHDIMQVTSGSANVVANKADIFLSQDNLIMLLLFLRNFQGYWPITRKYGEHVEQEVLDFTVHYEYSIPVLRIVKGVASSPASNVAVVKNAIELIVQFLKLRKLKMHGPGIADFKVSKEPSSFINPVNTLLSFVLQAQGYAHLEDKLLSVSNRDFLPITDISLRSIVLAHQVKTGFWIRNGVSVSRQASMYMGPFLRTLAYLRDIHINQLGALVQDPALTLYNILERWELAAWFNNSLAHDKTVYEDRFSSIIEGLLVFLYTLLTDRVVFNTLSGDEILRHQAKQAICYALVEEPKSHSQIRPGIETEIGEIADYDEILAECADYIEPTGFYGNGVYKLKPTVYEHLDPMNVLLDTTQYHAVLEVLVKNIAQVRNVPEREVLLEPCILQCESDHVNRNIGEFLKTKHAAKLFYRLLQVALDNADETYLSQLLHLLHAVIKDDELIHGKEYLNENLVRIPISDLLLTIVESNMSNYVIRKADQLIEVLMQKDDRVVDSLIDCFGPEHIQNYKRRKSEASATLEVEKKKLRSDKRKAKIMKKFEQQRQDFLAKNKDEIDDDDDKATDKATGLRTCISCGELESPDKAFGILASPVHTSIFWTIPSDDSDVTKAAFEPLSHKHPRLAYPYKEHHETRTRVPVTCGHGMHIECYRRLKMRSLALVFCPLCHALAELLIPTYPADETKVIGPESPLIVAPPLTSVYMDLVTGFTQNKSRDLMDHLVTTTNKLVIGHNEDHFAYDFLPISEENKPFQLVGALYHMYASLGDVIRSHEIASRLRCDDLGTYLDDMPSSAKQLVRTLFQDFAVKTKHLDLEKFSPHVFGYWRSPVFESMRDPFNEVVHLFFQTDESFVTLARMAVVKTIAKALMKMFMDNVYLSTFEHFEVSWEHNGALAKLIERFTSSIDQRKVFFAVQRILFPLLRSLHIFKSILTSKELGHNTVVAADGTEDFDVLPEENESSVALCEAIGIPTLDKFFEAMVSPDTFEYLIYEAVYEQLKVQTIFMLDYPGIIKLIDLPEDYNECLIGFDLEPQQGSICLHCGKRTQTLARHRRNCCKYFALFYYPQNNSYIVFLDLQGPVMFEMQGHYLTAHGEVKTSRNKARAKLHHGRYELLNKMWLNGSLFGIITRDMFGTRAGMQANMRQFTADMANVVDVDGDLVRVELDPETFGSELSEEEEWEE